MYASSDGLLANNQSVYFFQPKERHPVDVAQHISRSQTVYANSSSELDGKRINDSQFDRARHRIIRSQTVPAAASPDIPSKYALEKMREAQHISPVLSNKVQTIPYTETEIQLAAAPATPSANMAPKSSSLHAINSSETDGQFCHTCGRIVHPYLRIAVPGKVYHIDCAKCYICQISLGLSNYRDLGGRLYCSPHYAQAKAERIEGHRKPAIPRPQSAVDIGFTNINLVESAPILRSETRSRGDWKSSSLERTASKSLHTACSLSRSNTDVAQMTPGPVHHIKSPIIPPRPRPIPAQDPPKQEVLKMTSFVSTTPISQTALIYPVSPEMVREESMERQPACGMCTVCTKAVYPTTYINLGGKFVHIDCLACHICGARLNLNIYREYDGKAFCPSDYYAYLENREHQEEVRRSLLPPISPASTRRMVFDKTICYGCNKKVYPIEALYVMDRVYHKFCFKCQKCHGTLGVENYHVLNGSPYCKPHYKQLLYHSGPELNRVSVYEAEPVMTENVEPRSAKAESTICRTCEQPVHPRDGIHILQQYYHYDCFKCEHCKQKLNMGRFEMAQGKAYCPEDFLHLFGRNRGISARQSLVHLNELVRTRSADRPRNQIATSGQQIGFLQRS